MLRIFRNAKTYTLYIGANTYSSDQMLLLEREGENFSIKILFTDFYDIKEVHYTLIKNKEGNSFATADECEVYLKEIIEGKDLRIHRYLGVGVNVKNYDFTLLEHLNKESPSYERGRKTKSQYKDNIEGDLVVEKIFEDVRDGQGNLKKLKVTFNWYSEDGSIGLTKNQVVKNFNKHEAETEERQRRGRQIDYLVANAKDTPIEVHIDVLFTFYYNEIILYKEKNSSDFADAIERDWNDSTPSAETLQIQTILAIQIPRIDDPTKNISVRDSILYQIGQKTLEQIEQEMGI